jgi:anti-anti-sigma regulatory factor
MLRIMQKQLDDLCVLELQGELSLAEVETVAGEIDRREEPVALDLRELRFAEAGALWALFTGRKPMVLRCNPYVRLLLERSNVEVSWAEEPDSGPVAGTS